MRVFYRHYLCVGVDVVVVKIFAKVPYRQHYYDTGCVDEESLGMGRAADYSS